jgi:molybdenum cofactor guanylyltransferase
MAEGCSLLILAGGNSRRMGRDKATLAAGGRTLVEHLAERLSPVVDDVLVSVGRATPGLGEYPLVVDRFPGLGPLAGIHAGLLAARQPLVWVVACDLPNVEPALGSLLRQNAPGVDAVVPQVGDEPEGVCALYRRELAEQVETNLGRGSRSIKELLAIINVRFLSADQVRVVDTDLRSFQNLNTPADYQDWVRTR